MWTIVPAPTLATLAIAVTIPEITPWGVAGSVLAGTLAQIAGRGWARNVGFFCSALALGCALLPWCLLPSTIAACEREMRSAFGNAWPPREVAGAPGSTAQPYRLAVAVLGFRGPARPAIRRELPIRLRDGTLLNADLYTPAEPGPHRTVVVIYGGAWIFGKRADVAPVARGMTALGYTAIVIDYRHAPAFRFPVQFDDVRDALATIARNARAWDVDPRRVAMIGFSAGAQLALLAAYAPEPLTIRAAVAYYAPTDLVQGYRVPPQPDPADVDRILRAYLGGPPEERMNAYVSASPIARVRPGLPPTLLIGGGRDELVRLALQHHMRDALRRHGDRVAALDLPWSNHAFDAVANGTGGQIARYYTERFLALTL